MNSFLKVVFVGAGLAVLCLAGAQSAAEASCVKGTNPADAPSPLYNNLRPANRLNPHDFGTLPPMNINLRQRSPATSVDEAENGFSVRAAAAILYAAKADISNGGFKDEVNFGVGILAKMAYSDYFSGDDQIPGRSAPITLRQEVDDAICGEGVGNVGTTIHKLGINVDGEYDVLLTAFIKLYYKYYNALSPDARNHIFNVLLSQRGPYDDSEQFSLHVNAVPFGDVEESPKQRTTG